MSEQQEMGRIIDTWIAVIISVVLGTTFALGYIVGKIRGK